MINPFPTSRKFHELIALYEQMAVEGYDRRDGKRVEPGKVYASLEPAKFRHILKPLCRERNIRTVLDYGSGGGDWESPVEDGLGLRELLGCEEVRKFEPARKLDEKQKSDAVFCFDVLEHIFNTDVPKVVFELFEHAEKLVVANVACYEAAALLPNAENAHITSRPPQWWKGVFDTVATLFPEVDYQLLASPSYRKAEGFPVSNIKSKMDADGYVG